MSNFDYDVVVIGGGPAGFSAAIASARQGAKTALIERYGFCGGMSTVSNVNTLINYPAGTVDLSGTVYREMIQRIVKDGGGYGVNDLNAWVVVNAEDRKYHCDIMLQDANIDIFYHHSFVETTIINQIIKSIITIGKSGVKNEFFGKCFVDATGDADLAHLAGVETETGSPEGQQCQPMTMICSVGPINTKRAAQAGAKLINGKYLFWGDGDETLNQYVRKAETDGQWYIPRKGLAVLASDPRMPEIVTINGTRILGHNGDDSLSLSQAEIEGRKQVRYVAKFVHDYLPGFENAQLIATATQIGVRETKRIKGLYTLTESDVLQCKHFEDQIALAAYPIDDHSSISNNTDYRPLPEGRWYGIPYRCLINNRIGNLVVAGRILSATHKAASSARTTSICMSTGEAAGTAAAISCRDNTILKNINIILLQKKLGLILG